MKNNKERTAVWLYPETMERLDGWLNQDNCKSRSEIIEKALHRLRGRCVAEVKKTKGKIRLDDAVEFQNGAEAEE